MHFTFPYPHFKFKQTSSFHTRAYKHTLSQPTDQEKKNSILKSQSLPFQKILESKRDKLIDQLEEAKILKGNIDRRSVNVSALLSRYLTDEEFADYQHFINMKAKLIVDGREIQDKVKLGEEQLAALKEAIDL